MPHQVHCPQCVYITTQLGTRTACLLHVDEGLAKLEEVASARWQQHTAARAIATPEPLPAADSPGPFTTRELARLMVLRGRIREERGAPL